MTTLALVAIVSGIVAVLLVILRRLGGRATPNVDLSRITVSRQWLIQHQSNDRV